MSNLGLEFTGKHGYFIIDDWYIIANLSYVENEEKNTCLSCLCVYNNGWIGKNCMRQN